MYIKINNTLTKTAFLITDMKRNPIAMLKKLQRGDADGGGSTLRTLGVVTLVVAVLTVIGLAILGTSGRVSDTMNHDFVW